MFPDPSKRYYRFVVETEASFDDPDELLLTIEASLEACRRPGTTLAVWLESEIGPSHTDLTTEPLWK